MPVKYFPWLSVTSAVIGTGLIAFALAFTHRPAAFNSKPSTFIDGFNRTVRSYTGLGQNNDVAKSYCDDREKKCLYEAGMKTLNYRKDGTVWRAEIRNLIPEERNDADNADIKAEVARCLALIEYTSGLSFDHAKKVLAEMNDEAFNKAKTTGSYLGDSDREIGNNHYYRARARSSTNSIIICVAASNHHDDEED